jgi:hypothetical protein
MDSINKTTEYNGKAEEWKKWSKTFLPKARLRCYNEILTGSHPESESKDTKSKKDQRVLNELAYAELMLSCQEDICFDIIDAAKSEKWPEEDAALAWKRLEDCFEPKVLSN